MVVLTYFIDKFKISLDYIDYYYYLIIGKTIPVFGILRYSPIHGIVVSAGQGDKNNRIQINLKELIRIKMCISFFLI